MKHYPIPQRLNLGVLLFLLIAWDALLAWCRTAHGPWQLAGLAAAFALVGNMIYIVMHEAEHGLLLKNRRLNDGAGVFLAALFPGAFHLMRQGHLGHHQRNRSDDEAFDVYFPEDNDRPWKTLMFYGILLGWFYAITVFFNLILFLCPQVIRWRKAKVDRATAALLESLNHRYLRLIRLEILFAILLHAGLIFFLKLPALNYLLMYAAFGWAWSAVQYVHHYEAERDVLNGAHNLKIWRPIDWLLFNHNWHQVHHRHPTVSWLFLEKVGQREAPQQQSFFKAFVRMWRGPQPSQDHVENRHAGHLIR